MNYKKPSNRIRIWAEEFGISDIANIDIQTIKKELRTAQKVLREIDKNAKKLRS
jgi:hypothetical protein